MSIYIIHHSIFSKITYSTPVSLQNNTEREGWLQRRGETNNRGTEKILSVLISSIIKSFWGVWRWRKHNRWDLRPHQSDSIDGIFSRSLIKLIDLDLSIQSKPEFAADVKNPRRYSKSREAKMSLIYYYYDSSKKKLHRGQKQRTRTADPRTEKDLVPTDTGLINFTS